MLLKADLHIHSNYSDGKSSIKEILNVAIDRRLDIISITDHDTVEGSLEALDIVREEHLPIIVLPGVEVTTAQGHMLAYGVEKDLDKGMDMGDAAELVRKLGGISSLAHPFQFYRHGAIRLKCFRVVDCVEVFNAKSPWPFNGISELFREQFGKGKTAGSDAHKADFVGYGIALIEIEDPSLKGIMNALKMGKCDIRGKTAMFQR